MTMAQVDQLSACPSCAEPPEQGDLFCGACGSDLRTPAQRAAAYDDRPTAGMNDEPLPRLPDGPAPGAAPDAAARPESRKSGGGGARGGGTARTSRGDAANRDAAAGGAPANGHGTSAPEHAHTSTEADFLLQPAAPTARTSAERSERGDDDGRAHSTEDSATGADASPPMPPPPPPRPASAAPRRSYTPQPSQAVDPRTADPQELRDDTPGRTAEPSGPATAAAAAKPAVPRCVACGTGAIDADGYCEHCGHKQPQPRDHMEHELRYVAAASDRGLRHHRNEDFFAIDAPVMADGTTATIAVVCDGVSSASRSDEASAAAAEAARASMSVSVPRGVHTQQAMHEALLAAGKAVADLATDEDAESQRNAPACTIVSAVTAGGLLTVGWIGDSRAYWVPEDRTSSAARLTEDDSWAAQMVAAGLMNEADAYADPRAHAITGWLGADAYDLEPHTASFKPEQPGVIVVCTDGLWNYAESADEMAAAVPPDARSRPMRCAQHLVGYALDAGGHDNVTVALVPFPAPDERAGSA